VPDREQVRALTLNNGMKVIVWPDHDIPNVALQNWVRVGSRNEAPGITGLAHFFEHMMFNGTTRRSPGEFDRELEAMGGANNAFTSDDVTVYENWLPRSALELIFELEADRLANLSFDPKAIESEREVVYSERRLSVEDSNEGSLFEQMQATAFVAHPYQFPTIGWPSDIQTWRLQDLQAFFRTFYAPNNCTLVVVGDVEPDEVFALARKHLEPIPRQAPPPIVRTQEPEQFGEKRVIVERKAKTELLYYAYKAPNATDASMPAINLLLTILAGGDASRLHRSLVEQRELAIDVSAFVQEGFDPGLAWLLLSLPEGADVGIVQGVLDSELGRIGREGVSALELQRAQRLTQSGFWKSVATIDGKARLLGEYETIYGDYRKLFDAPASYDSVSTAQIQDVARKLLQQRRRTVGILVPRSPAPEG
jgi:zinc protease